MAVSAHHAAIGMIFPPFLDHLRYSVSAIGTLASMGPILALAARIPSGVVYRRGRTKPLMAAALAVIIACDLLYSFAVEPWALALVHSLNGFAYGAATTFYLAFFVEALPPDEDRPHAMGYYSGSMAVGYSAGAYFAGWITDRLGYPAAFQLAASLAFIGLVMFFFLREVGAAPAQGASQRRGHSGVWLALKSMADPNIAALMTVALFLNLLFQMGHTFLPLYGLGVGLALADIGLIKGLYALCNALTRPLGGPVVKRLGHQVVSRAGLPLQSAFMMLVPFFHDLGPLLVVFLMAGLLRAVVIVANTISMVEDVDESRMGRGMASGLFNAAGDLGAILGPSLGGWVASFTGVRDLFIVGPLLIVGAFFLTLWGCRFVGREK